MVGLSFKAHLPAVSSRRDLWQERPIWSSYDGHTNSIRSNCYKLTHQFYPPPADLSDFSPVGLDIDCKQFLFQVLWENSSGAMLVVSGVVSSKDIVGTFGIDHKN